MTKTTLKPQITALIEKGESNKSISTTTGASVVYISKVRKKLGIVATPVVKEPKVKAAVVKDKPTSVKTAAVSKAKRKEAKIETNPALATTWVKPSKK